MIIFPRPFVIINEERFSICKEVRHVLTDDELVRRMTAGDEAAAETLVKRYYAEILRYCHWHAPTRMLAEDAAQETFLKFIRYAPRYQARGRLRALLYQIARHTCIDMARRRSLCDVSLDESAEPACEDAGFTEARTRATLRELVQTLPQAQREIVLLRFAQDLTLREIAQVTGLPLRTVQSRLRAALKRLRTTCEREDLL